MSELYGRFKPLFIGYTIFTIFQIPVAVAQNLETSGSGRSHFVPNRCDFRWTYLWTDHVRSLIFFD